jgi:hypothetical protein
VPDDKDSKMSDQQKPAAVPSDDSKTLQLLVQLLLAERQESMLERQEKAKARAAREDQRKQNSEYNIQEKRQAQAICTHKKGGRGLKGPKVDFAVSFHTFVNSESYIRCLICGMKWKNTDTDDFIIRRGEKIENHTGIGWKKAYQMVTESSNTATSSEVKLVASPEAPQKPNFKIDSRAVEI